MSFLKPVRLLLVLSQPALHVTKVLKALRAEGLRQARALVRRQGREARRPIGVGMLVLGLKARTWKAIGPI